MAYNQDYLHDGLAIRIGAMPQWLSAAPTSGRLWAGESMPINVHIDAASLEGGSYPGQVNILTNDPAHPVLTVDVTLDVTGAPDAVVAPGSLEYGDRFLAQPAELILTVRNSGTDLLEVSDIVTSHGDFVASPADVQPLPAGGPGRDRDLDASGARPLQRNRHGVQQRRGAAQHRRAGHG